MLCVRGCFDSVTSRIDRGVRQFGLVLLSLLSVAGLQASINEIILLQDRMSQLKQEKGVLVNHIESFVPLNIQMAKQVAKQSQVTIVLEDFFSPAKQTGQIVVDIYRKFRSNEKLLIQKHHWSSQPLYVINQVVFSLRDFSSVNQLRQKLRSTLSYEDWVEVMPSDDFKSVTLRFKEDDIKVVASPSIEDLERFKSLELDMDQVQDKIDKAIKKRVVDVQSEELRKDDKWDVVFLRDAPDEFIRDVEEEVAQADRTPFQSAQLPWYLQILKNIKRSGYRFKNNDLEKKVLDRAMNLLPEYMSPSDLYAMLQQHDGIKRVLVDVQNHEKEFRQQDFDAFMKELKGFFIIKNEGAVNKNKNYYLRHGRFKALVFFLRNKPQVFEFFLTERYQKGRDDFIQVMGEIKRSSELLRKKLSYPDSVRQKYTYLSKVCDNLVMEGTMIQYNAKAFSIFFNSLNKIERIKALWVYVVMQDFIFYQPGISLDRDVLSQRMLSTEISKEGVWGQLIYDFLQHFPQNALRFIGLGYSRPELFSRSWESLVQNVMYSLQAHYPAEIILDDQGQSTLKLRADVFQLLKDDVEGGDIGAMLWAKTFLASALFRSIGIVEDRLATMLLVYTLDVYSTQDRKAMYRYFETKLMGLLNYEECHWSGFQELFTLNIMDTSMNVNTKALYNHIDRIITGLLKTCQKIRQTAKYRLMKVS